MRAGLRFKGQVSARVIRAQPSFWQWLVDGLQRFLREL